MKNVYFVQVDISACFGAQNAYLPYTAAILAASAWQSETVKSAYRFKEFIFLREDPIRVAARMESPAIVAFTCYCWNTEYNKALAAAVKERYPQCITIFGGHNVPDDFSFLEQFSFIDFLVHGEGEEPLRALLETIAQEGDYRAVPNISFRGARGACVRTDSVVPTGLDYPSPYLEGWFDTLMQAHPDIIFNAILETSRGCPHRCAYCDWGLLKSKVRLFPLERVKAEIKWMSDHRISFVWGADANFGLFERDLEIADALVAAKETTGYPERMRMNYAKNNYENVFEIVKKFKVCDFDRIGATLSFQSMSPEVLKNIGRSNRELNFYKNLLTKYNKENMKTYSELILGLPGETYESFIAGIGKLFEIGQHFVFDVYACILLPNSIMGQKDFVTKFGFETAKTELFRFHAQSRAFEIPEYNTIITQTNTMSREKWVRSMSFFYITRALHGGGPLRGFAMYLFSQQQIHYEQFYDGLIDYFETHPDLFTSKLYLEIKHHVSEQAVGGNIRKLSFEPCGNIVWDDHEFMLLHILNRWDRFFDDVLPFLQGFSIPEDVFADLLAYQKAVMRRPGDKEQLISLNYDVHGFLSDVYINQMHDLIPKKHRLKMTDSKLHQDWISFAKTVVWFERMGWTSYKDDIREV